MGIFVPPSLVFRGFCLMEFSSKPYKFPIKLYPLGLNPHKKQERDTIKERQIRVS